MPRDDKTFDDETLRDFRATNVPPSIAVGVDDGGDGSVPPLVTENEQPVVEAPPPALAEPASVDDEADQPKVPVDPRVAKREAIYENAKRARAEDDKGPPETLADFEEKPATEAPARQQAPAQQQPAASDYIDLVVDGATKRVLRSQVDELGGVAAATTHLRAQSALAEARRLNEASGRSGTDQQPGRQAVDPGQAQPGKPADGRKPPVDPAKLQAVTEAMQAGTLEEGNKALASLLEDVVQTARAEAAPVAAETIALQSEQRLFADATQALTQVFPDVRTNRMLATESVNLMIDAVESEFKRIGVPEDQIRSLNRTPALVLEAYQRLRAERRPDNGQPWGLAEPIAVYRYVTNNLRRLGFQPAPQYRGIGDQGNGNGNGRVAVDTNARVEAKRGFVIQPKTASRGTVARKPEPVTQANGNVPRGSAAVQRMKDTRPHTASRKVH